MALFVIGNLFQFSPEIAGNHKFFNLFIIGANIFAAYSIYNLWTHSLIGKAVAIFYLVLMTLSGVIDIFPIKNDGYSEIKDGKNNEVEQFIINNTPKESVFINAFYTYDPASLAGRKIFLGWPYFSWSAGYDTDTRINLMKKIMEPSNLGNICSLLRGEGVGYIEVQNPTSFGNIDINYSFFENNFRKIFSSSETDINIYDVGFSCKHK